MKKIFTGALLFFASINAKASLDTVNVGPGLSNTFSPASLTICLSDTVLFVWNSGIHNVHITSPVDSISNNLTTIGDFFLYVPTNTGLHDYQCDFHVGMGMIGTFTVNEAPSASLNLINNASCNGASDGSIDINATGGGLSYLWSNSATTEDVAGLTADTYSVVISNSCGNFLLDSIIVTEPSVIVISDDSSLNVVCYGDSTGAGYYSASGGISPYSFLWSDGSTTDDLINAVSGTYQLTVTDQNGCTKITTPANELIIDQPASPNVITTDSVKNVLCNGDSTGAIYISVSSSAPPFTYLWSNTSTTEDISSLAAGIYSCTVTDSEGCLVSIFDTIFEPLPLVTSISVFNASCNGSSDGEIEMAVGGGTGSWTYIWSNSATSQDITGISAGTYTVTVTDANGCSAIDSAFINEPALVSASVTGIDISCTGANDGSADLTVSDGSGSFIYSWSTADTTEDIDSLSPGSYTVTVVDVTCSDTATVSVTITEPGSVLSISLSVTDVTCGGGSDGAVDLTPTGGTTPYAFTWSNSQTTEDIDSLVAGDYTVTVSDANLCALIVDTATITEPPAMATGATKTDVTGCPGDSTGSIDLTVTGGTPPYTYSWNNGATDEDIDSLPAGAYGCTVTDASGCTKTRSQMIFNPSAVNIFQTIVTNVQCNGDSTGALNILIMGGTTPYTYLWSNGETSEDLSGIPAGAYTVTVTDAGTCTDDQSVNVTQPAALSLSITGTDVSCSGGNNGFADLTVTGGSGSFVYFWSSGGNDEDADSLSAGTYTVTVWDPTCTVGDSTSITINEPATPLSLSIAVTDVTCGGGNDGAMDLTVSGGVSPYGYEWSNSETIEDIAALSAGIYSCTVTDSAGCVVTVSDTVNEPVIIAISSLVNNASCNGSSDGAIDISVSGGTGAYTFIWSGSETTEDVSGLTAGTYFVTVNDASGCSATDSAIVNEPAPLSAAITGIDVNCNGDSSGAADLSVSGGSGDLGFSWSTTDTTEDLSGLGAGSYTVTVTDVVCLDVVSASVTITEPASAVSASTSVTNLLCNGDGSGSIDITVTGGTAPYLYGWSNGSSAEDINNLNAGDYSVTVSDSLGCQFIAYDTVYQPAAIILNITVTDASGCSQADGDATVSISGGTPGYSIQWDVAAASQTTSTATGLAIGSYSITVTDANNCTSVTTANVSSAGAPSVNGIVSDITCFGSADGAIDVTVSGGTLPYTHLWSTGNTSEDLSGLLPGNYTDTLTDSAGCKIVTSFAVSEPVLLTFSTIVTDVSCAGTGDGSINLTVSGGTVPFVHSWSTGSTAEDLTDLDGGIYSDTVTDANGCSGLLSDTVIEPAALSLSSVVTDASCFGGSDGSIDLTVGGGISPFAYLWSDSILTEDRNGLGADAYSLTVTDVNGCSATDMVFINEPSVLSAGISGADASCNGLNDGSANLTASGGSGNFDFLWSDNSANEDLSGVTAGTYSVTVADLTCGDTVTATVTINEPSVITPTVSETDVTCFGLCDGSYTINATGGTPPYTGTGTVTNQCQGSYSLTVTDNNGCTSAATATITQPPVLSLSATSTNATCNGQCDGTATATVSGGTPGYTYLWCDFSTSSSATGLCAGSCPVIVNDANGCMVNTSVTIGQPPAITISLSPTDESFCGANDGLMIASVSGGNAPYTYEWNTGQTIPFLSGLSAGTYSITVTDSKGCTSTGIDSVDCQLSTIDVQMSGQEWLVVPNPSSDGKITLVGSVSGTEEISVELSNLLGEKIASFKGSSVKNQFRRSFDLSTYGKGIYLMRIRTQSLIVVKKIAVQ